MKSIFTFNENDSDANSFVRALIDLDREDVRYTIKYQREGADFTETFKGSRGDRLQFVLDKGFRFVEIVRHLFVAQIDYPEDPLFWSEDRKTFQCGHCMTQFTRETYFYHWTDSKRCQHADCENGIRTTFPYLDLRGYKSRAAAAKALHKKLIDLGYDEAFIFSPKEQKARGESEFWRVGLEGGPFEWAVAWTGTGAASGDFGYCECYYSFDVSFVE